jgi:chromosome segregation ATPase
MAKKGEAKTMTPAERIDSVIKAGRYFQCVIDIGRDLERIGNIEQAEAEANASLARTKAELEATNGNVSTAKERLAEVSAQIAEREAEYRRLEDMRAGWDKAIKDHEGEIAAMIRHKEDLVLRTAELEKESDDKLKGVNAKAEKIIADANKVKAEAAEERKAAKDELAIVSGQVKTARDDLADIQAKIAAAKAQIQSMFGGFGGHI